MKIVLEPGASKMATFPPSRALEPFQILPGALEPLRGPVCYLGCTVKKYFCE